MVYLFRSTVIRDQHLWEAEEGSGWAEGKLNVTQEIGSPHSPSDLSRFGPEWLGLYPPCLRLTLMCDFG